MYHQIDKKPAKGTPMRGLVVSPFNFYLHMLSLWLCGYRGLSMTELEPYLNREKHGKVFGITFDDGYENNLINALPILKRFGFTSTCYIVARNVGSTNSWDETNNIPQVSLMNVKQLKTWIASGQEIGSHGLTHANLTTLTDSQQTYEIVNSRKELEKMIDDEMMVRHFCYPYGAYNLYSLNCVEVAGYTTSTTTHRGRVYDEDSIDLKELPRVLVSRTTSFIHLFLKFFTRYEFNKN